MTFSAAGTLLPLPMWQRCKALGILPTRQILLVSLRRQKLDLVAPLRGFNTRRCTLLRTYTISTSRFGIGQQANSNCTPLGLHRVARKIGGGWPIGAVFKSRKLMGYTWAGLPFAPITNRILWLEGLEPGFNRGGKVDTFARYIYIHGTGDEAGIGRPASHGCIHVAGSELLPLYDCLAVKTLVWIDS